MHDVGLLGTQQFSQAPGEAQIIIAGAGKGRQWNALFACRNANV